MFMLASCESPPPSLGPMKATAGGRVLKMFTRSQTGAATVVAEDATIPCGHTISGKQTPFDTSGDVLN